MPLLSLGVNILEGPMAFKKIYSWAGSGVDKWISTFSEVWKLGLGSQTVSNSQFKSG